MFLCSPLRTSFLNLRLVLSELDLYAILQPVLVEFLHSLPSL